MDSSQKYFAFIGPHVTDEIAAFFVQHGAYGCARKKAYLHTQREKCLLYIKSGIVGSYTVNNNLPKPRLLRITMPGFICNGQLFVNKTIIAATPFAITDAEFYKMEVDQVEEILKDDYEMYRRMVKYFGKDMGSRMEGLFIMLTLGAEMRLRILLRSLVLCTGQREDTEWLTIPRGITREQYAMCVYVTTNTLDTILQEWKNLGVFKKIGDERCIHRRLIDSVYRQGDSFTDRLYNEDWK